MRKRKKISKNISDGSVPPGTPHREDFETCPHCDKKIECDDWDIAAKTLIIEITGGKHGSIAVISVCPKCFERSWVHHPIDSFKYSDFPEDWKEAAEKEYNERKLDALRDWGKGLCWECSNLKSGEVTTAAIARCSGMFGRPPTEYEGCRNFRKQ